MFNLIHDQKWKCKPARKSFTPPTGKEQKVSDLESSDRCLNFLQTALKGRGRVWWEETEEYKGNEVGQELRKVEAG